MYAECFRSLGINDPDKIRKMKLTEYKAFQKGSVLKRIDELEDLHTLAFQTAMAGSHDKHGKPVYRTFKDMFDRKKYEDALLGGFSKKEKVNPETVEKFKRSKEHAENLLNGITATSYEESN